MSTKVTQILISKGIRPSPQRVAVYEALFGRSDHPSTEKIFHELRPSMPTMSKTTVLDALRLFQNAGLFRDVRCEEGELRFDGNVQFHAHFKCRACGELFDIPVETPHSTTYTKLPEGFDVDDEQLIYYGLCKTCSKKKGQDK